MLWILNIHEELPTSCHADAISNDKTFDPMSPGVERGFPVLMLRRCRSAERLSSIKLAPQMTCTRCMVSGVHYLPSDLIRFGRVRFNPKPQSQSANHSRV